MPTATTTMRAQQLDSFGDADSLRTVEIDVPTPAAGEVLVRVTASSINPVDSKTRQGGGVVAPGRGIDPPFVLGWDVSGRIESVGDGTSKWRVGDAVFGLVRFPNPGATNAEYVAVPADELAAAPSGIELTHAAALPLVALTAWQVFKERVKLQAGERVLVLGAAGGVGHIAIQLAKALGATHVAGTARAERHDALRELGIDEAIDHTTGGLDEISEPFDVVFDTIGGLTKAAYVAPGGRAGFITAPPSDEERAAIDAKGAAVCEHLLVRPEGKQLDKIRQLVDANELHPVIARQYSLDQLADAHRLLDGGHVFGKIIVQP